MKDFTTSKEAENIYAAIEGRLDELMLKIMKGDYNTATPFAYKIGFIADIDAALRTMKMKRTPVKMKNVREIEVKDFDGMIGLEEEDGDT